MAVLELRPHHINCIFFYRGKGYSEEFVERMDEVVRQLREEDNQSIRLKCGKDFLCKACPHLREEACVNNERVKKLDYATLEGYGLEEDIIYNFKMIKTQIYQAYDADLFEQICRECEWFKQGVCSREKIIDQQNIWKTLIT